MWTCEHVASTTADAEAVWARYSDPVSWPSWDQLASTVHFEGEFVEGARGVLTLDGRPSSRFRLISVEPGVAYVDRTRLATSRIDISHRISPAAAGVSLTHRVTITGPFSRLLGSFIGGRVSRQQAGALTRLVALVESG